MEEAERRRPRADLLAADPGRALGEKGLEQFQQKCTAVLRPELRKDKELERFRDSKKSGNALEAAAQMALNTKGPAG
ncbi:hypothetical protein CPY51_01565 [Rhizobium tubonense]|uniref:Uncharacterized protein n=1 Tax=Rhizobium tubonense TaxID=484088 RepID=A0A2W4D0B5_9HYPH|nr:hypothetical protein CPY51_01565 [Rhizobium tubonense]